MLYMFQAVFFRSSGAQNCTYSVRYLSDQYCYLLLAWPRARLAAGSMKHVEHLREINKLRNVASCWLYSTNILAMHGPMNVKFSEYYFTALIFRVQVKDGTAAFCKMSVFIY